MSIRRIYPIAALAALTFLWETVRQPAHGQVVPPAAATQMAVRPARDIPPGFDFPADRDRLQAAACDVRAMRLHGWRLFAGLTQPAEEGIPAFSTWYSKRQTLDMESPAFPALPFSLEPAQQLVSFRDGIPNSPPLVSVLFNRAAFEFIRFQRLHDKNNLKEMWNQQMMDVPEFPLDSVVIKAVWWPIRKNGRTVLPVWTGEGTRPIDCGVSGDMHPCHQGNDYSTWPQLVAIEPGGDHRPSYGTTEIDYYDVSTNVQTPSTAPTRRYSNVQVVSLDRFYYVPLSASDVSAYGARLSNFANLMHQIYDVRITTENLEEYLQGMILVGMHVATKELKDWFWCTFWWHVDPGSGPYAADRSDQVRGVWRHFRMDVVTDREAPDRGPMVAYNPWLEGAFANGLISNCKMCHQRAAFRPDYSFGRESHTVFRSPLRLDDPYYTGGSNPRNRNMRLDYLWSLTDIRGAGR